MRGDLKISIVILTSILFLSTIVMATDVAYIFKNAKKIDQNIINVFNEMGHSVDIINEKNLPSDFSSYSLVFIGDERLRNKRSINIDQMPTVLSNYHYTKTWGLADRERTSKLSSRSILFVNKDGQKVEVYNENKHTVSKRTRMIYYYISNQNKATEMTKAAGTFTGHLTHDEGDVIAYINSGTTLGNGKTAQHNICFFGLIKTNLWTSESEQMFKDCVSFVLNSQTPTPDPIPEPDMNMTNMTEPEPDPMPEPEMNITDPIPTGLHDIALIEFINSVGNIRLEKTDGTDILEGESLMCNEKYKIGIKVKNNGDFTEDTTYSGSINGIDFNHLPKLGLDPTATSTKTKTVNFTLSSGEHTITVNAHLAPEFTDATPADNIAQRTVDVICDDS
jgi:hypothetical protein